MSMNFSATLTIVYIWLFGFSLAISSILIIFLLGYIESVHLVTTLKSLARAYSPHLAIMIGFIFKSSGRFESRSAKHGHLFLLACVLSVVWNATLLGIIFDTVFGHWTIDEAAGAITEFMPLLSWLVSPFVGYLFSTASAEQDSRAD
ncbi:hypothetical protein CR51_37315 [Caballeronia megalochromosomata]|nr:hypothetical protein CR51_37315 [Caballeronia megalochromosomata]